MLNQAAIAEMARIIDDEIMKNAFTCSSHSPMGEHCERRPGHVRPHRGEGAEWWSA